MVIATYLASRITRPRGHQIYTGLLITDEHTDCESPGNEKNKS